MNHRQQDIVAPQTADQVGQIAGPLKRFFNDQSAATAVEYAIMLALVSGVILAAGFATGGVSALVWTGNADAINATTN